MIWNKIKNSFNLSPLSPPLHKMERGKQRGRFKDTKSNKLLTFPPLQKTSSLKRKGSLILRFGNLPERDPLFFIYILKF